MIPDTDDLPDPRNMPDWDDITDTNNFQTLTTCRTGTISRFGTSGCEAGVRVDRNSTRMVEYFRRSPLSTRRA